MRSLSFWPKNKQGKWSVGLIFAFFILLAIGNFIVYFQGPREDETFLDNPLLSITMLSALLSGILAFFVGVKSIFKHKERSLLVFIATLLGGFALMFALGEILFEH